jgi:hypothetical protein
MADATVAAGEIPYGSQFGVSSVAVRLGDFVAGMDLPQARRVYDAATDHGQRAIPPPFIFHAFPVRHPKPLGTLTPSPPATRLQFALRFPIEHVTAAEAAEKEADELYERGLHRRAAALYKKCAHIAELSAAGAMEGHTMLEQRVRCHSGRVWSLTAMDRSEQGLAEAELAVRLHPSEHSLGARCSAYFMLAQLAEAERDCQCALAVARGRADSDISRRQQQRLQRLLAKIAAGRTTRPLEALGALMAGDNATLPWFLRANAIAALVAANRNDSDSAPALEPASRFRIKEAVRQFIIGGRGGGAPAHPHSHAVNSMAWGMKRWRMWAPHQSHFSATSPWYGWRNGEGAQHSEFVECTQRAGDIVYVPASWGHSVLNLRDSVGQTTEFEVQLDGEEL